MMAAVRLVEQLNEQVAHEFAAAQQYVANAVFYDARTLPRLADFFYAQALEERNHALMMVRYLLDSGATPVIPGVAAPVATFDDLVAPVVVALEQEKRVTDQISALMAVAREERTTKAKASCSGSSRSRRRRSRPCQTCSP
jgi:ferritin